MNEVTSEKYELESMLYSHVPPGFPEVIVLSAGKFCLGR